VRFFFFRNNKHQAAAMDEQTEGSSYFTESGDESDSDSDDMEPRCPACGGPAHGPPEDDDGDSSDADDDLEGSHCGEWAARCYPSLYAAVRAGDVHGALEVYHRHLEREQQQRRQEQGPGNNPDATAAAAAAHAAAAAAALLHAPGGKSRLTPLMLAAKMGNAEMVRAIGRMAPALDKVSKATDQTALAIALANGHAEAAVALWETGADPSAPLGGHHGHSSLRGGFVSAPRGPRAGEEACDAALGALLGVSCAAAARGASAASPPAAPLPPPPPPPRRGVDLEVRDANGQTLLLLALTCRRLRPAHLLLEHGARADALGDRRRSAISVLLDAVAAGSTRAEEGEGVNQMVAALLERGAFAHPGLDDLGDCSLFRAARLRHPALLRLLLDSPGGSEALRARAPNDGRTVLHMACAPMRRLPGGSAVVDDAAVPVTSHVRVLLERGADPTVADDEGRVPAFDAVQTSQEPMLRLLLSAAPPGYASSKSHNGDTLLMSAATANRFPCPCLRLLLRSGADARAVKTGGRDGAESAADVLLARARRDGESKWYKYQGAIVALMCAGAPVNPRNASLALEFLPAARRLIERKARRRAARSAVPARRAEQQEEMVGLALDVRELREARAEVAVRQARLRELEGEG